MKNKHQRPAALPLRVRNRNQRLSLNAIHNPSFLHKPGMCGDKSEHERGDNELKLFHM